MVGGPNFGWDYCARVITEEEKAGLDLSSVVTAYNGSEPVRAGTLDYFYLAFRRQGFRREAFFPCYGLAESTLFVSGGPAARPPEVLEIDRRRSRAQPRGVTPKARPRSLTRWWVAEGRGSIQP